MNGSKRRAILVAVIAFVLGIAAWVAAVMLSNTRMEIESGGEEAGALRVFTRMPAATCSKTLTPAFPWVRFACEPHEEEGAPPQ